MQPQGATSMCPYHVVTQHQQERRLRSGCEVAKVLQQGLLQKTSHQQAADKAACGTCREQLTTWH